MSAIMKSIRAAFGDVEMVPYTVLVERGGYEERHYKSKKWACMSVKCMNYTEVVSPVFRALFSYISGRNKPNIRVDMTSPVITYVEPGADPTKESIFTMGFMVPEEYQNDPPAPLHKHIFIVERPDIVVLTRRFGGFVNDEVVAKEVKELSKVLKAGDEEEVNYDQYYIVGYDPPFKLFGRRNEIWFVKAKSRKIEEQNVISDDVIQSELNQCVVTEEKQNGEEKQYGDVH